MKDPKRDHVFDNHPYSRMKGHSALLASLDLTDGDKRSSTVARVHK